MADVWEDLIGTQLGHFQLGIGGPNVSNVASSTDMAANDAANSALVAFRSALFKTFGNDFELNSGATESGASWKLTFRRPSTGMTSDVVLVFPSDPAPTANAALAVASVSSGVITLQWLVVAAGTDSLKTDTTAVAFGTSSPITMFTLPANAEIAFIDVIVDTAFDGTPTLSVGITGTTSKFMPTSAVDLKATAKTRFRYHPNEPASGSTTALIATYSAGSASVGAAHIIVYYSIPS